MKRSQLFSLFVNIEICKIRDRIEKERKVIFLEWFHKKRICRLDDEKIKIEKMFKKAIMLNKMIEENTI